MARPTKPPKSSKASKQVDALKHDAASRRNIPTAEMESFFRRDEDASPMPPKHYPRARPLAEGTTRTSEDPRAPELSAEAFDAARAVADTERRYAEAAYVGSLLFERKRDPDLAFQIAREWGKAQEPAKVCEWLGAAAELGFRDVVQIDHCPDFFALHGSSAFQSARQRVAENV